MPCSICRRNGHNRITCGRRAAKKIEELRAEIKAKQKELEEEYCILKKAQLWEKKHSIASDKKEVSDDEGAWHEVDPDVFEC